MAPDGVKPEENSPTRRGVLRKRGVSTSDLASVLARHRVRRVVLNACRSAQYQDADHSIALGILQAGVDECVAMTFNVVSRAVEIFMSVFYDAVLTKGLALDAAAAWARQALRLKPDRTSRYAASVPVYDYMIPICYTHTFPRDSGAYNFTGSLRFARRPPFHDVVGREDDILSIETRLLSSEKGLWLCGRPGVGKTALLRHLSAWWLETGLATGVYLYDCRAAAPRWSVESFWRGAHDMFLPTAEFQGPDAVVGHFRQNRCIVMIDNLPLSAERPCDRFISRILNKLDRGTKVILASRSDEGWGNLDGFFEPKREALAGLDKLGSLQLLRTYMERAIRDMTGQAAKSVGDSSDDLHCFEQIASLLRGNPAAFRVVIAAFLHSRANTMKEFLGSLILGEPLMGSQAAQRHLMSMAQTEDLPCVAELLGIVQTLDTPTTGKYAVPVELLAPFWELLPRRDLPLLDAAYADQVSKGLIGDSTPADRIAILRALVGQDGAGVPDLPGLSPEFKSAAAKFKSAAAELGNHPDSYLESPGFKALMTTLSNIPPASSGMKGGDRTLFLVKEGPDFADFVRKSPVFSHLDEACARIVDPLAAAHFLFVDSQEPRGDFKTNYYRIQPLLPLLLRTSPLYHSNGTEAPNIRTAYFKQAFIFYYTYRARTWPFEHQYFEPEWQGVREELGLEFVNFVSAIAMHSDIAKDAPNITMESLAPMSLASVLHRGVGTQVSRFQLVHLAQEKALAFILDQEKRISDSAEAPDAEKKKILFLLRMFGASLAMLRRSFVGSPSSEENKPFAALGRALHQRTQQMGTQFVEEMWATAKITPARVRYWDRCHEIMSDPAGLGAEWLGSEEMWKLRHDFMRDSAARTGETSYASQKTWEDLPMHAISGNEFRSELVLALKQARDAVDRGQLVQARKIFDGAWKREVLDRNDDGHHKARLLELRAEICERDGDWESGAEHRSEVRRLLEAPRSDGLGVLGPLAQESWTPRFFQGLMTRAPGGVPLQEPWITIFFWQTMATPMDDSELWVAGSFWEMMSAPSLEPWRTVLLWQAMTTPMDASELWMAIFFSQLMSAPSPEPWMAIFFWQPMATPMAAPGLWVAIFFWSVVQPMIPVLDRLREVYDRSAEQAQGGI